MKRNSGIIGLKQNISPVTTSGIFDTFDQYNNRRLSNWPSVISYNSTSFNSGTIFENTNQSITLNTTGIVVNTTLFWTILHGNSVASDFFGSTVSGSFTQSSSTNTGTFGVATSFTGNTAKIAKTFQIQIRTGSTSGPVVYTTGTYTIPTITVSDLYFGQTTINENVTTNLFFRCGNCGTSFTHSFTLTNTGTITAADISGGLPTSLVLNPGNLSVPAYTTLNDFATEGTETLTIQISFGGFNLGAALTLTVNDTSLAPTSGTINPSITSVTEGNLITFTCTINNSFTGTAFYSVNNITGIMSGADFSDGVLTGSIAFSNGNGSFTKTLVADGVAEGEQFSVSLRIGSISGTVFATTATITVTDAELSTVGQVEFTIPGTYSWTAPAGVTSVCAVVVAGGGGGGQSGADGSSGGGGGGLAWGNNIPVTPGSSYTVSVGSGGAVRTNGGQSFFIDTATVWAVGGTCGSLNGTLPGGAGGGFLGGANRGGGPGGAGGNSSTFDSANSQSEAGGGGGAGGYSGAGGQGAGTQLFQTGQNGSGGGGGGGGSPDFTGSAGGGGGVGIYGQGANGTGGVNSSRGSSGSGGGSGGSVNGHDGGNFGGGGAGSDSTVSGIGGSGAVRIIWGAGRAFPSTNTQNM
jgi:hypothetical protein